MVRSLCFFFVVFLNLVICFGQSHKTTILINPIKDTCVELDSSFVTLNFDDFFLYYTPNEPFELSVHNITDSNQILLSAAFCLKKSAKKDHLEIKSVKFEYIDKKLELSKKDRLKIVNYTLSSLKKKTYYIKYYNDVKQDWTYYIYIPVILIPLNNNL